MHTPKIKNICINNTLQCSFLFIRDLEKQLKPSYKFGTDNYSYTLKFKVTYEATNPQIS